MRLKTTLAVIALTLSPSLALAMGCSEKHNVTASSCKEGSTWDQTTGTCVETPSS